MPEHAAKLGRGTLGKAANAQKIISAFKASRTWPDFLLARPGSEWPKTDLPKAVFRAKTTWWACRSTILVLLKIYGTVLRAHGSVARGGRAYTSVVGNVRGAASRVDEPSERP